MIFVMRDCQDDGMKTMGKPEENDDFKGFYRIYPLVMTNIAIENGHLKMFMIFIAISPLKHGDFP